MNLYEMVLVYSATPEETVVKTVGHHQRVHVFESLPVIDERSKHFLKC